MTEAEQLLWQHLRRKQIHDVQFYRQKPLLSFIVDFYCPVAKLVIELDGAQHYEAEHQTRDQERDAALSGIGLIVLRFNNRQVLMETESVLAEIDRVVQDRILYNLPVVQDFICRGMMIHDALGSYRSTHKNK